MPTRVEFQGLPGVDLKFVPATPTVVGPFKTVVQAQRAGKRDWDNDPDVQWTVAPLFGYSDAQDQQVSLLYDRLLDPGLRTRCLVCKQTIKQEKGEDDARIPA